jgi:hypothetical protein
MSHLWAKELLEIVWTSTQCCGAGAGAGRLAGAGVEAGMKFRLPAPGQTKDIYTVPYLSFYYLMKMLNPNSYKLCQQVQAVAKTFLKVGAGAVAEINCFAFQHCIYQFHRSPHPGIPEHKDLTFFPRVPTTVSVKLKQEDGGRVSLLQYSHILI